MALLLLCLGTVLAGAATRTWTGAAIANNLWSNATNWGLVLPVNGDSLFFPFTAGNKSSVNNLGVTNYATLTFGGSNYVFSGGTLGLSGGILSTNRGGTNTFLTQLLLRASQSIHVSNSAARLQIAGSLNLNGNNLTFLGGGGVRVLAAITGTGDLIKAGFGDLSLEAASSFSGTTYVALAHLYVRHPLALGDTNFPVVVTNLTRRVFLGTNTFVTNKTLKLGFLAELWGEGGTNGWYGPIEFTSTDPFLRLDNGGRLHLGGPISGAADWHMIGPGTAVLEGPQANTASGTWNLRDGVTVLLNQPPGLSSGHRYLIAEGSTVRLLASDQLSNTRSFTLSDGTLDLNGFSDRIAFLADSSTNGSGRVLFGASGTNALTFGSTTSTSIFSGTLSGAGDLVKIGGSTHILRGTNNSAGDTIINGAGGVLAVHGRITGPTLATNGMLTGTGRVAVLTLNGANAVLNPGLGTNSTARLILTGTSSWLGGRVQLELNGLTPVTQHDQIQADAAVNITGCALQVTLGFAPALGNSFTIVNNTTASPINGYFVGLPEGAALDVNGTLLRISYVGGTGNDITLTVVNSQITGVARVWNGAGSDNFWLTGPNWIGGTRPGGGDSLVFPAGAGRRLNTNNFPADGLFNSLLLGTNGLDLRGNALTLLGGVTATNPFGSVFVRTSLTLATNQALTARGAGSLFLTGPVAAGPHALSVNATGLVALSGTLTGSGALAKFGDADLSIGGTNALTGTNFIEQGTYFVDGSVPNSRVRIGPGATLSGLGYVGRVQCFGTIAPAEAGSLGRLTFGDDVRLSTGSVARFKLESAAPDGYDQLVMTNANGLFALSNATLVIEPIATLTLGSAFTLIDKAGVNDIVGTFNGLPENASFAVGDSVCSITYQGGDGNDVVVTVAYTGSTGMERVWTGAAFPDTNWSNSANWSGNVLPGSGDSLVFPGTSLGKTNFNNLPASTIFQSLRFSTGACNYRISSAASLPLVGGLRSTNASFNPSLLTPVRLLADQVFENFVAGVAVLISGIETDGHELTLISQPGAGFGLSGVLSGSGGLRKRGAGSLNLSAAGSYTGPTVIEAGAVGVANSLAFGSAASGTIVSNGATVTMSVVSLNVPEPLTLAGTLSAGIITTSVWSGPITLTAPVVTLAANMTAVGGPVSLRLAGPISGPGGFTKTGVGTVFLTAANTFDGESVVSAGRLVISSELALGSGLSGTFVADGARLELGPGLPPVVGEGLTLHGTLAVSDTGTLYVWDGEITLASANATIEVAPVSGNFSHLELPSSLSGPGGLIKTGIGVLELQGDNSYSGVTRIAAGTLAINGNQIDSSVTVSNGAVLAGNGQCGFVSSFGGTVSPGVFDNVGILRVAGGMALDAASAFKAKLLDPGAHDQLRVFGTVDLGGAALHLVPLAEPEFGSTFEILRNDSVDPIVGAFAGLTNNAVFANGGYQWRILYTGGDGNDVVVTLLGLGPSGLVREWTGDGVPNTNWSVAANWLGNSEPAGGDDLFFPGSIDNLRKTNFYDLPAGSIFNRLHFGNGQARYRILGSTPLRLLNGIEVTNTTFGPSLSVPLQLVVGQTFSNTGPGGLRVTSVNLETNQLTFDGAGSFVVDGGVSGAGGLVKRGAGPLRFNGASTFTGPVTVEAGSVELNANAALGGASGGTVVAEGASVVLIGNSRTVPEPLVLSGTLGGGTFVNNSWTGPITIVAPDAVVDVAGGGLLRIASVIGGNAGLTKTGNGTLDLAATNTVTGPTLVQGGTLLANGVHTNSALMVAANSTLGGTGLVASLTVNGGRLAPNTVGEAGTLRVAGNLALAGGGTLLLDLNSPTPGTGHDQVVVSGNVQLACPPPVVTPGFVPGPSVSIVVIRNDGPGAVSGTFDGVEQGGSFTSGAFVWQVNYSGGDGNDVALSLLGTNAPGSTTSVWTGGGFPDGNWSNAANWSDNLAPQAGANLVFPGTALSKSMTNNLGPSVFFNGLRFATGSCNYLFSAPAPLRLHAGVTLTNSTFGPFFRSPFAIEMQASQAFEAHGAALSLPEINTAGHQATFITTSNIFCNVISGAGGIVKRGPGSLSLADPNTYSGATVVEEGVVEIWRSQSLGETGAGTTVGPGGRLSLRQAAPSVPEPLNLAGGVEVSFASQSEAWSGPVTLAAADAAFEVTAFNSVLQVTGLMTGSGGLVKTGSGTLILGADNTYSGPTQVRAGTLLVTNSHLSGVVTAEGSNTVLQIGGAVGGVTSSAASVNAGIGAASATLEVAGDLELDAATRFNVDLNGPGAGTGFDQWRVGGTVDLGGAALTMPIRFVPSVGATFILLQKDSAGPVTGTFAGLPQDASFTRGAFRWQISYTGGDGNDVQVSVVSQALPGFVWDGGGTGSNWTASLNWLGDSAAVAGADLIFPVEAAGRTNFNDFPPGTGFGSIRYSGATAGTGRRHIALGNALLVTNGLTCEGDAGQTIFGAALTMAGAAPITVVSPASLTLTGAVGTIAGDLALAGSGSITFNTPINAGGGLISAAGFVQLRSNNTFAGSSLISTGTVRVDANGVFGDEANTVTVESPGRLQVQNAGDVANPLVLRGRLEAFRTNTWSGPVTAEGTSAFISSGLGPFTFDGGISGSGELTLSGSFAGGPLVLNAANSYAGVMRLASGTLLVNGTVTGGTLTVATNPAFSRTVLAGTGTAGSVFAGGTIAPGPPANTGILGVAGDLSLSNSAVLEIQINGPDAGTDHDQLRVSGGVSIDHATLATAQLPAFLPDVGANFVLIRNDGPGPISGTFAGLPEGGFVTNCAVFRITYAGGDGNDVVLIVTAQKGLVSQWTGNGGDTNWSNGANWLCGLPPDPGDTLVFSNGFPNRITHNDFPPNTTFGRLTFLGFNFDQPFFVGGNPITLTGGIEGFHAGSNVISMPITLAAPQTFSNAFGLLVLRSGVANGGHHLALTGGGQFDFVGPYSGAGGLSWSNRAFSFATLQLRTNNPYSGPTAFDGFVAVYAYDRGAFGGSASGTYVGRDVQCLLQVPMTLDEPVTVAGRLDFENGVNAMGAPLTIEGTNALMCISGPRMDFNGPIGGSGRLQICGIGTNFYNGGGGFSGAFEIFAGQHTFMGDYPAAEIRVGGGTFFSSTLAGTGRLGGIVASDQETNSILAPGVDGTGILRVDGRFVIESNITLRLELDGTTPGTGHDQLDVGGPVALTNCTLELAFGFAPGPGDSFTLVNNTGPDPVRGAFVGLPEGALIAVDAMTLELTYTGGDGNDIVLRPPGASQAEITSVVNLPNGTKQLGILGQANATYVIEASPILVSPPNLIPWVRISTNTADGLGLFQFIDTGATNFPNRFYRVSTPTP